MRYLAKVVRQVRVHCFPVARVDQSVHLIHCIKRAPSRSIGVLLRRQVRFDNRRQHQHRRRLRYSVAYTGEFPRVDIPHAASLE